VGLSLHNRYALNVMKRYTHILIIGGMAVTLLIVGMVFYAGNNCCMPQTDHEKAENRTKNNITKPQRAPFNPPSAVPLADQKPPIKAKPPSSARSVLTAKPPPPTPARNRLPSGKTTPKVKPRDNGRVANPDHRVGGLNTNTAPTQEAGSTGAEELPAMVWSVDKDGIQGAIQDTTPAIKECYQAWLKAEQAIGGRIVIRFTISANPENPDIGQITDVGVNDSELDHTLLEGCVLNAVSETVWVAPDEPLTVNYPFSFSSNK